MDVIFSFSFLIYTHTPLEHNDCYSWFGSCARSANKIVGADVTGEEGHPYLKHEY